MGDALSQGTSFLDRARVEAARYGPDPWVFVRELLQNARDAGARRISFEVSAGEAQTRIVCTDDGEGMSFEHARRYLFRLYASSKEGDRRQVGRFGVGFWSVLRFEPSRIVVTSRPREGMGWRVEIAGALEAVEVEQRAAALAHPGTRVELVRPGAVPDLERKIFEAVWQNGRFLEVLDRPGTPVEITVNGRRAVDRFELPPPASTFRRGRERGVVGLSSTPRIELFSRGLRVRSAATLGDLFSASERATSRSLVHFDLLPEGLAPQAILESERLELMLSRDDARSDAALRRLVGLAERELKRVVSRQLAALCPQPWWRRVLDRLGEFELLRRPVRLAGLALLLAAVLAAGLFVRGHGGAPDPWPALPEPAASEAQAIGAYEGLGAAYRGPLGTGTRWEQPIGLAYEPAGERIYLGILRMRDPTAGARALDRATWRPHRPRVMLGTTRLRIHLNRRGGAIRVPVPAGYGVVSASFQGKAIPLWETPEGEVVADFPPGLESEGVLAYVTAPLVREKGPQAPAALPPLPPSELPEPFRRMVTQVQGLPVHLRVAFLAHYVGRTLAYRPGSLEVPPGQGGPAALLAAAASQRAGDCDVQNGVLVLLLQAAGVPARLAVGYVGEDGAAVPTLHAWAEYVHDGVWRVADATRYAERVVPGEARQARGRGLAPVSLRTGVHPAPGERP
ncbi:MAG: hypothetical protein D6729_16100, partial [Deltaproteobacteria bacterium]